MSTVIYTKVPQWVKEYGSSGMPDSRGVADFIECETSESVRALQAELSAIAAGRYTDEYLDKLVGMKRKERHGNYTEWAKLMLMWIASTKR